MRCPVAVNHEKKVACMKGYEIIFIVDPNIGEEGQQALLDKTKEIYAGAGGSVIHDANWGRRKLAYRVKKLEYGIYFLLYVDRVADALKDLENQFRFNPDIIKWQTVAIDDVDQEHAAFQQLKSEGTLAQKISDRGR